MAREVTTPEGLTHVKWCWEHEVDWVRHVMRTTTIKGYKYCLVPSQVSSRLFSFRTNMKLTKRLQTRIESRPMSTPEYAAYFPHREQEEE